MAFMMPVVKNDYNIYPSCPSSRAPSRNSSTPQSRGSSLSSSPGSTGASFMSSPKNFRTPAVATPKSGSQSSLNKFHSKLLDRLRSAFRGRADGEAGESLTRRSSVTPVS